MTLGNPFSNRYPYTYQGEDNHIFEERSTFASDRRAAISPQLALDLLEAILIAIYEQNRSQVWTELVKKKSRRLQRISHQKASNWSTQKHFFFDPRVHRNINQDVTQIKANFNFIVFPQNVEQEKLSRETYLLLFQCCILSGSQVGHMFKM